MRFSDYILSMRFCLERIFYSLRRLGQTSDAEGPVLTHVLCESRGRNEDADLELAFRRICGGDNFGNIHLPFEPVLTDKKNNSIGLQLADLVARPIGLKQLRPVSPIVHGMSSSGSWTATHWAATSDTV
ncbi:MAG: DUF3800 domain-containing protein [Stenotrophomonas sp.]|uniref:DUF3800 domain-containing protein n=1 Tax=Stenotrophomonas sp. TaxID=69392 RepID=UPI0029A31BE0|nr:DUF3800 domain-containing protein [Stenotrophomonas sp.]MDX3930597.1 DUF3800 domain-containing protein [Stenotrophomonas sp.]